MEIIRKTIEGVNPKRIEEGMIGFISEGKWYNVVGEPEPLKELLKNVISKGNIIEFEYNNGVVGSLSLIEKAPEQTSFKDQLDKVNYKTLTNQAHKIGLVKMEVEFVPELSNASLKTACFKATATIKRLISVEEEPKEFVYQTFEDFGDACGLEESEGGNIDQKTIRNAWIRMASTRAQVRALKQATNNMEVAEEELPSGKTE